MEISKDLIPENPPKWYKSWPGKEQLAPKFPDAIRMHYIRSKKPRVGGLMFQADGFAAAIDGTFRVTWSNEDDKWAVKCSCSYPKDTCVHAWFLVVLLDHCARLQNWPKNGKTKAPKGVNAPHIPKKKEKIDNEFSQEVSDGDQMLLPFVKKNKNPDGEIKTLDVEADFRLNPGYVTLRFYEVKDGRRSILRMQRLFNLTQAVVMQREDGWADKDFKFLSWLRKKIEAQHVWKSNLQVLKLTEGKFEDWVYAWRAQPDRFLDRETQKPVALKVPASIHFELVPEGEKVRIKCFVSTSMDNKQEFCKVFHSIRDKAKCVLNGTLVKLEIPISWQTLVDCFSKKSPAMPKVALSDHLPTILESRLDLIQGNNVRHIKEEKDLTLRARTEDSSIQLEAVDHEGKVVTRSFECASKIVIRGNVFEVTRIDSPVLDVLRSIPQQLNPGGEYTTRFPQSERIMETLCDIWASIPVAKSTDKTLERILAEPSRPQLMLNLKEDKNWLDYSLSWKIGGAHLQHDEMKYAASTDRKLYRNRQGDWFHLDIDDLKTNLDKLEKLHFNQQSGKKLNVEGKFILEQLKEQAFIPPSCSEIAENIRNMEELPEPQIPSALKEKLRHYQAAGVEFMHNRLFYNLGVILADDMGLGKTFQTLSLIGSLKLNKPALVVAPASVVYVWQDEIDKFIPDLKKVILTGTPDARKKILDNAHEYDVIIANYHIVRNDLDFLELLEFSLVVLDEAQMIKNPQAKITHSVKRLKSEKRLALSGTPVENRLSDLWSIFDFLIPGFLGSYQQFSDKYESGGASRQELAERVSPLILRRTKEKVAKELPPRTEEVIRCSMEPEQLELYKKLKADAKNQVKQSKFSIFAALTRLRQTCCDPALLGEEFEAINSAKLDCLTEMLEPIVDEGHSVLVFSQFTSMLEIIERKLNKKKMKSFKLTGATPTSKRPALVKDFNDCEDPSVFLLSLKAAGTGLTLTKADYVFIYDPWWNPAAERQAVDRAHRIGQDKPVFVYKLVVQGSVEEKILKLQEEKKQMIQEVISDDELPQHLTTSELAGLLDD
ncbi:MAG: DEAD/DEAH box helicase [Lentisphaeraceae bacterium]|nr:DEAD/DEAH box helicase [Lentisphaeraceae bacterium]